MPQGALPHGATAGPPKPEGRTVPTIERKPDRPSVTRATLGDLRASTPYSDLSVLVVRAEA